MNIVPFSTIYYYLSGQDTTGTIPNLLGNILIFVPFGLLLPLLNAKFKTFKYLILCSFVCSLFFETIQLLIAYGTFDIDDCILNIIGALIGFLLFKCLESYLSFATKLERRP
jgi:glycopeptide antibiotics resistance protein